MRITLANNGEEETKINECRESTMDTRRIEKDASEAVLIGERRQVGVVLRQGNKMASRGCDTGRFETFQEIEEQ